MPPQPLTSEAGPSTDLFVEDFGPPIWRTVLNKRADLGYPDFYPSRPGFGQPEDILTEENVKNGYSARPFVTVTSAESFSMHGPIHNQLVNGCLATLNKLGREIIEKRDECMPQFGERAFRIPVRVTYNDVKRTQFLSDLANPNVPLYKLMRNPIPHGFKGLELLDTMFSPSFVPAHNRSISGPQASALPQSIAIDRAVWFIRVLGSNEISAHRGRAQPVSAPSAPSPAAAVTPSSSLSQNTSVALPLSSSDWHTQEFTTLYTNWLRIQLGQLSLPTVQTRGVPAPRSGATSVLGDEKARARWLVKWNYSLALLRQLFNRHLISARVLGAWLVDMLASSNLAQLGFVARLAADHITALARHVHIARPCLRAACDRIVEIREAKMPLENVEMVLKSLIQVLCRCDEMALMNPSLWRKHRDLILSLVNPSPSIASLEERSKVLMFKPPSTGSLSTPRRQQMEDLQKLDSMNAETNMLQLCLSYFDGNASPTSSTLDVGRFDEKVVVLLNWAMGSFQLGIHRAYAVHTLLVMWREKFDEHQSKATRSAAMDFFPTLYQWLDTSEAAKSRQNAQAIGITFGELTRQGLFSYGRYLQTLIAQGHSARFDLSASSHHLRILRSLPIFVQGKDLLHQRRLALTGGNKQLLAMHETEEKEIMAEFEEECKEFVPEVFGYKRYGASTQYKEAVYHHLRSTNKITRHLFLQARFWIYPLAVSSLVIQGRRPAIDASAFARILHVFRECNGYSTMADYLVKALQINRDIDILDCIIDTIRRDADVWTAMDRWELLTDALMERNAAQDTAGQHHAALASLLVELARRDRLSAEDLAEVQSSIDSHRKARPDPSTTFFDGAQSMDGVRQVMAKGDVTAASLLGAKLFVRHGPFENWSTLWWETLVDAIQTSTHATIVDAVTAQIATVFEQAEGQLDSVVDAWLQTVTNPIELLSNGSHLCTILLHECAHRHLRLVSRTLETLVYPVWAKCAAATLKDGSCSHPLSVTNSVTLCQQLLLTKPPNQSLPPTSLRQALVLQTERGETLKGAHVISLLQHLPFLVILEKGSATPERLQTQISLLLEQLAATPHFKAAAFRHLDVLKDAFLSNEWSESSMENLEAGMVDVLKMIMSQGTNNDIASLESSPRSSAWRWTSIVLSMRVDFKRLAMRINSDGDTSEAKTTLSQLVRSNLDRDMSADDADLLCEAIRGIERVVAQEIISFGIERLGALLAQVIDADSQAQTDHPCKSIDLLLRVLDSASRTSPLPWGDHAILTARHALLDLISVALQSIERQFASDESELPGDDPPKSSELLHVAFRLLRFSLGLPIVESPNPTLPRPDFGRLATAFARLLSALPTSIGDRATIRLGDMLAYILDSAPSRATVHSALVAEVSLHQSKASILQALSILSIRHRPTALNLGDDTVPLDDRPWELFERLDPKPRRAKGQDFYLASKKYKDTAAISMALFAPRIEYDAMPRDEEDDDAASEASDPDLYASERDLGNDLAGESSMLKQFTTAIYGGPEEASIEDDIVIHHASPTTSVSSPSNLLRPRRASTRGMPTGSDKDPIPLVDDDDDDDDDDDSGSEEDEPELLPPRGKRPRVASKSTGSVGGKTTRKTTGGKM
ncbi:hypothetical protein BD324DRAFT_186207 [Kockovaella imperatae]|uniref:Mediator of RNA polymerase II transcription subunit 12 n=1 Tax=Kockovaella imperatae TaxID=4999 RepID=A0A1Y1U7F1_9TREE|nr:hypothetical protein BD324DRAFT_186207 [Kockovaella imperatae]ORX33960.1 hypothetical protein BD324DRAFT_186207 [Kockovaella imperatae]